MTIGSRIKERRLYLGLSAEELGRRLGKDRATIYRYENGDIENMPLDVLKPLAETLETTPAYLAGWEIKKDNDTMSDVVVRMRSDEAFYKAVLALNELNSSKLAGAVQVLKAFQSSDEAFYKAVLALNELNSSKLAGVVQMLKAFQE